MVKAPPWEPTWMPWVGPRLARGGFVVAGAWVVTVAVAAVLQPDAAGHGTHRQLGLAPCPCAVIFNRPCPGCGLTTSWTALVHGMVGLSFRAHPLGPLLFGLFTVWAALGLRGALTGRQLNFSHPPLHRLMVAVAVIFFTFGLARFLLVNDYATMSEQLTAIRAFVRR